MNEGATLFSQAGPVSTAIILGLLALVPFVLMISTPFLKFTVVLSILRNALGTQQIPPNPIIMGLSAVLAVYVMTPTAKETYEIIKPQMENTSFSKIITNEENWKPVKSFLKKHSHAKEIKFFHDWIRKLAPQGQIPNVTHESFLVLLPAFAISELTEAFAIGFLIFLPFLIIDMVISNILLAMGMHMLSPVVISMPFKLLLFIMIDGWSILTKGILEGYL